MRNARSARSCCWWMDRGTTGHSLNHLLPELLAALLEMVLEHRLTGLL